MSKKKSGGHGNLTYYIIGAIAAAIATGYFAPEIAVKFDVGGEVFLSLLMMMVVPLVVMSVMSGILGLGDVRKLGKPGAYAIGYYMCTTVLAVVVGLIVVNLIKPGVNKELATAQSIAKSTTGETRKEAEDKAKAIKDKIKADVESKNESTSEEAKEALKEKDRIKGLYLEKYKLRLKHAESILKRAQKAQEGSPNDEFLKEDVEIAKINFQEAQDAVDSEKKFIAKHKEKTIWDIIQNMFSKNRSLFIAIYFESSKSQFLRKLATYFF